MLNRPGTAYLAVLLPACCPLACAAGTLDLISIVQGLYARPGAGDGRDAGLSTEPFSTQHAITRYADR